MHAPAPSAADAPVVAVTRHGAEPAGDWQETTDGLETTLAHDRAWLDVIVRAYRHAPLYLSARDARGDRGVLPAFFVRRPLAGSVVTSMPFLDSGGPATDTGSIGRALLDRLLDEARAGGAHLVEVRSTRRLDLPGDCREDKVNLTLSLPADPETLWRALDGRVRNQVRKAERSGLTVERAGVDRLDAFYRPFSARMHDLGSPVHARSFFAAVFSAFGRRASLFVVRKQGEPVGALVALRYKQAVAVPWAGCLEEHFRLCPNMLLYWEALKTACREGLARFEFGRSTRGSGTWRFKMQWGAVEQPLFWHTVPVGSTRVSRSSSARRHFFAGSWRCLPRAVTRQVGPVIRRYLTQ